MDPPAWTPATEREQAMAEALERGDGPEYVRLLGSASLLLPMPPDPGSTQADQLAEILPPGSPYLPVFTSVEALLWTFGDLIDSYQELELGALLQRWPSPAYLLAVDPGTPIAVHLPPLLIGELAAGRKHLIPTEEIHQATTEAARVELRRLCLQELSGVAEVDLAPRPDQPADPREAALQEAVARGDGQGFLHTLLAGQPVLLLTEMPVGDPAAIFEERFPWRVLGGERTRMIAVFSSRAMLDRTGATHPTWLEVDFLHVLANWPGEAYLLCVNPGSRLELMLTGETVLEVVSTMAEELEPG